VSPPGHCANRQTVQDGVWVFLREEAKRVKNSPGAEDERSGDDVGVVGLSRADGDSLAFEVDVSISGPGVCSGLDFDGVAVVGIIDCGLDVAEIGGVIVVNGDYSGHAGAGCEEYSEK
jgi:hypothetical protein